MSSDIRDLVAVLARLGAHALLLTVNEQERPFATAVRISWIEGQLIVPVPADQRAVGHLLERPFVSLLWPPESDGGSYVTLECLADLLGDQLLMTPLKAQRHGPDELIFEAA
ncbi:MAG: pyridoxamine 5'-phosphate oxidase family protein [Acidimicrobiia bacterium]